MKERPIIFSGEMVRAILEGRKTQTRRVIKERWQLCRSPEDEPEWFVEICPYGKPGDRLWVREGIRRHFPGEATYLADLTPVMGKGPTGVSLYGRAQVPWLWKQDWLSARFMPRWANRLTLEITGVRVERLQDISNRDRIAEGILKSTNQDMFIAYQRLWDALNAKRGYPWSSNPWVWGIEFRRVE